MVSADNDSQNLPVIGWREWLSFPELGIPGLKAKIDTGARSSALHTHDYEIYEDPEGISRVRFHLHPLRGRADIELSCDAKVTGMREVKDSGGHIEHRPFITVAADLGGVVWRSVSPIGNQCDSECCWGGRRFEEIFSSTLDVPIFWAKVSPVSIPAVDALRDEWSSCSSPFPSFFANYDSHFLAS